MHEIGTFVLVVLAKHISYCLISYFTKWCLQGETVDTSPLSTPGWSGTIETSVYTRAVRGSIAQTSPNSRFIVVLGCR